MMKCDILVVGAGPAGSAAALEASKAGARVVIVEKKKTIGQPVQCGEMIPRTLLKGVEIPQRSIAQEIETSKTVLPSGEWFKTDSPSYILDRTVFDKELAVQAVKDGAHLLIRTQCVSKQGDKVILRKGGRKMEISPMVIIGADGPLSTVGKWIAQVNREFCIGLQYEVPLRAPSDCVEFYFDHDFFGGYGWLYQRGETANVGLIAKRNKESEPLHTDELLRKFTQRLCSDKKIEDSSVSMTGGLIPVGGSLDTVRDNIVLVGDAAGQTHPITGGGIEQAFLCGKIAGEVASEAIRENDLRMLHKYELKWRYFLGKELKRACERRKILESHWDELDSVIKKCWIMFEEYFE